MEIFVRRLVVQNVAEVFSHVPVEAQFWSKGTSGHLVALAVVSLAGAQSKPASGRQRSEVVNSTWAVGLTVSASDNFEP